MGRNRKKTGNPALEKYVAANPGDSVTAQTLRWSAAVNKSIAGLVRGVPLFRMCANVSIK